MEKFVDKNVQRQHVNKAGLLVLGTVREYFEKNKTEMDYRYIIG